jgi:hypothetical protein
VLAFLVVVSTDLKSMEAEKLTPKKPPLADALASKVDLYDLVPEIKQKRTSSIYLKNPLYYTS